MCRASAPDWKLFSSVLSLSVVSVGLLHWIEEVVVAWEN